MQYCDNSNLYVKNLSPRDLRQYFIKSIKSFLKKKIKKILFKEVSINKNIKFNKNFITNGTNLNRRILIIKK